VRVLACWPAMSLGVPKCPSTPWDARSEARTETSHSGRRSTSRFTAVPLLCAGCWPATRPRWTGRPTCAREIIDRLDGRPVQSVDCGGAPITQLTDSQLYTTECSKRTCWLCHPRTAKPIIP